VLTSFFPLAKLFYTVALLEVGSLLERMQV
jgi:hypothetical protein